MSEQIEPGDGWRLMPDKTPLKEGDEIWQDADHLFNRKAGWRPILIGFVGGTAHGFKVRRRIPAKPEAMEIWNAFKVECGYSPDQWAILQAGPPDSAGDVVVGNAIEARKLADWLNRYADWREAQDAAK